jgi:hypothetical protein
MYDMEPISSHLIYISILVKKSLKRTIYLLARYTAILKIQKYSPESLWCVRTEERQFFFCEFF